MQETVKIRIKSLEVVHDMDVTGRLDKVQESIRKRRGRCIICGERVYDEDDHLEVAEGYCHKDCVFEGKIEGPVPA